MMPGGATIPRGVQKKRFRCNSSALDRASTLSIQNSFRFLTYHDNSTVISASAPLFREDDARSGAFRSVVEHCMASDSALPKAYYAVSIARTG